MQYVSTRGRAAPHPFREAVMAGLAPDGGLFLPESLPDFSDRLESWRGLDFPELSRAVVTPFLGGALADDDLAALTARSYGVFDHPKVIPVRRVGEVFLCELFHGPTLAFKDVALQFLGNLFEYFLAPSRGRLTIVGATSGDTGSAAIHALKGRSGIEVFILFPLGRVSPMQELQMTTVSEGNVHPVAVEGSFDDAQAMVKGLFNDRAFNEEADLGAVNSINWARVMVQITYFFYAYFRVLDELSGGHGTMRLGDPVRFAVPTGNFGHIYAGLLARRMGLPVERLILATNENAILHELVATGRYRRGAVRHTLSPSMDIQVASNFERYLFDLAGRDAGQVTAWLETLEREGGFSLEPALRTRVGEDFITERVDDEQTLATIAAVHAGHGTLLDPHSAIGFRAAQAHRAGGIPVIAMATAHPAKFSEAIRRAIGRDPELPPALARLAELPTRVKVLPARLEPVREYIRSMLPPNPELRTRKPN